LPKVGNGTRGAPKNAWSLLLRSIASLSRFDPVATMRSPWWLLLFSSSRAAFKAKSAS